MYLDNQTFQPYLVVYDHFNSKTMDATTTPSLLGRDFHQIVLLLFTLICYHGVLVWRNLSSSHKKNWHRWILISSVKCILGLGPFSLVQDVRDSNSGPSHCWPWGRGWLLTRAYITSISTPHWEQAEGQGPAGGWEKTWAVIPQGKVRAHHLHTEQNTYGSRQGRECEEIRQQQHILSTKAFHIRQLLK